MLKSLRRSSALLCYFLSSSSPHYQFASAFLAVSTPLSSAFTSAATTGKSNLSRNSCQRPFQTCKMTATTSEMTTKTTLEQHSESYKALIQKLKDITHLNRASSVLAYDQKVFMPHADAPSAARGKQLAVLAKISHEKSTEKEIGELLEKAGKDLIDLYGDGDSVNEDEKEDYATAKRIIELEKDAYQKRICIPSELAARKAELEATAYSAWVKARENNDFSEFAPVLKQCFDMAKEIADLQRSATTPEGQEPISLYSQMLDTFEMGMPAARIDELFSQVQSALVPLIAKVRASPNAPSLAPLSGKFPIDAQKEACRQIVTSLGYDSTHGRIDVSVHPFTMSVSGPSDVRITSRFQDSEWYQGLMGTIHEGGHAMYEQHLQKSDLGIDEALSMGVHESQSLFWERHVGKSTSFYDWAESILKGQFDEEFGKYSAKELYGAVNAVDFENLIRVDADELTYPLHVILRYNIERDVVLGKLDVNDIPARWNSEMKSFLDIDVPDDARGALQDIHWSVMAIGYFPTYLLGSMMAAQLAHYCKKDIPDMYEKIKDGKFDEIREWLTRKVHVHGKRYKSLDDLLVGEVGEKLNAQYFIDYLTEKYTDLYKVE